MSFVLWITGLPCSGKTTLINSISNNLKKKDIPILMNLTVLKMILNLM